MVRKRRYLLNTNVPLSAYYEWIARKRGVRLQPYTLQWLRRYGRLSYYSNLLELELRGTPIKSHVISLLRSYGVERLSSDKGRLRRRAVRLLKEYGLSLRFIVDAMYVLLAKEYGLVIVSYDKDIELLANILGVACKKPLGEPRGPQHLSQQGGRKSCKRGAKNKRQNRSSRRARGESERKRKRR